MLRRTVREYRANEMTWIPGNGKIAWQAFDGRHVEVARIFVRLDRSVEDLHVTAMLPFFVNLSPPFSRFSHLFLIHQAVSNTIAHLDGEKIFQPVNLRKWDEGVCAFVKTSLQVK